MCPINPRCQLLSRLHSGSLSMCCGSTRTDSFLGRPSVWARLHAARAASPRNCHDRRHHRHIRRSGEQVEISLAVRFMSASEGIESSSESNLLGALTGFGFASAAGVGSFPLPPCLLASASGPRRFQSCSDPARPCPATCPFAGAPRRRSAILLDVLADDLGQLPKKSRCHSFSCFVSDLSPSMLAGHSRRVPIALTVRAVLHFRIAADGRLGLPFVNACHCLPPASHSPETHLVVQHQFRVHTRYARA